MSAQTPSCVHYWVLDTPARIVNGVCKLCGATRSFNGTFDLPYEKTREVLIVASVDREIRGYLGERFGHEV